MKKQVELDERILAQTRKVQSEGYTILMFGLIIALLVQQLAFGADFEQVAGEFICFFGVSLYVVIRSYAKGIAIGYHKNRQRMKLMLTPIVMAVTMALVNIYYNYAEYFGGASPDWGNLVFGSLLSAMVAGLCSFGILWLIFKASDRRQAKIERVLDEDEVSE
jgi:hypothetical protein